MSQSNIQEYALSHLNRPALFFQELLTTIVRIRAGRGQSVPVDVFRSRALELLAKAEERMQQRGYSAPEIKEYAAFAVIAFLDESVLSAPGNAFRGYATNPVGSQKYGVHSAGEVFFERVDALLLAQDSPRIADLLEIYQLCILLGYRGRYGPGRDADLHSYEDRIAAKLLRIRGSSDVLAPFVLPPNDTLPADRDVWSKRLMWAAVSAMVLALIMFFVYRTGLRASISEVSSILATLFLKEV
jgi:type VI secretion system protein ImpK